MGLDASAICSTSRADGSSPSRESESHVRAALFLRGFVRKGTGIETDVSARGLGVAGTGVSSCSASSLVVPVVEFDTLSIDRRDIISSRVDAFIGRTEKREESAFARRLEVMFDPLGGVEMVAGEWEREWEGVDDMRVERASGGALALDDGGGKKERLVGGTLRTMGKGSKLLGSECETRLRAASSLLDPCANNEATASRLA
jgi:hypothetical protein